MSFFVRNITIVGPQEAGIRATLVNPTRGINPVTQAVTLCGVNAGTVEHLMARGVSAQLHVVEDGGRSGIIPVRVDDLAGLTGKMLMHTLDPDSYRQGHVRPKDLAAAQQLLLRLQASGVDLAGKFKPVDTPPIDWESLPFGLNHCKAMVVASAPKGANWDEAVTDIEDCVYPFDNLRINPAAQVLHYAQGLFEGLNICMDDDGNIIGYRIRRNCARMIVGARRACLTPASVEFLFRLIKMGALANEEQIPPPGVDADWYGRPFHFGSGAMMRVAPAPFETIVVIGSPKGKYYKDGFTPISLVTETRLHRAMPYGTGNTKIIANYIMGMIAQIEAKKAHFDEVLWLSLDNEYVNEVGAANIFCRKGDKIYTPRISSITGTVLPGITRDSVIKLARAMGFEVIEGDIPVRFLLKADEVWCTGTAAAITPVGSITHRGKRVEFNNGQVGNFTQLFYDSLLAIKRNRFHAEVLRRVDPRALAQLRHNWIDVLKKAA